ncbi:hypothetical membrane protein [Corynebacterium kutscheri]|uniref:Hypothetical membrane protein n=1 Tax=Corynebacterium kutscheri TaxID=35755 RepID=A0AB38VZ60_9CORY|nr:hypothetical protein [Corynebacterium kutscheri]VEH08920.1 hypothetical membrane protein [Corynebacterium kutscheri]VEH80050.1 hypothetical membrane protein [Corynebacterium kutscheri]
MTDNAANTTSNSSTSTQDTDFTDHRRPLVRALRIGARSLLVFTILSLMGWGAVSGLSGIWGVLIGAAIGGGFVLLTALSVLIAADTSAATTGIIVLGGWLIKIVVFIAILALIRDLTFYDNIAMFVTVVTALVITLAAETWAVITTRVTYID